MGLLGGLLLLVLLAYYWIALVILSSVFLVFWAGVGSWRSYLRRRAAAPAPRRARHRARP